MTKRRRVVERMERPPVAGSPWRRFRALLPLVVVAGLFVIGAIAVSPVVAEAVTPGQAQAQAAGGCGTTPFIGPSVPNLQCGNAPDLPERWGIQSYQMYTDLTPSPNNALPGMINGLASLAFQLAAMIGQIGLELIEMIFQVDLVSIFGQPGGASNSIEAGLYTKIGTAMSGFAFIGISWGIVTRRIRRDHKGVFATMAIGVLGFALTAFWIADPTYMTTQIDSLGTGADYTAATWFTAADPRWQAEKGLPQYSGNPQAPQAYAAVRMYEDSAWRTFVFDPWLDATFGGYFAQNGPSGPIAFACDSGTVQNGATNPASNWPVIGGIINRGTPGSHQYKGVQDHPAADPGACNGQPTMADAVLAYEAAEGSSAPPSNSNSTSSSNNSSSNTTLNPDQGNIESLVNWYGGGERNSVNPTPALSYLQGNSFGTRAVTGALTLPGVVLFLIMVGAGAFARFGAELGLLALTVIGPVVFLWSAATSSLRPLRWFFLSAFTFGVLQITGPLVVVLLLEVIQLIDQTANFVNLAPQLWWVEPLFNTALIFLLIKFRKPLMSVASSGLHLSPAIHSVLTLNRPKRFTQPPRDPELLGAPLGQRALPSGGGAGGGRQGGGAMAPSPASPGQPAAYVVSSGQVIVLPQFAHATTGTGASPGRGKEPKSLDKLADGAGITAGVMQGDPESIRRWGSLAGERIRNVGGIRKGFHAARAANMALDRLPYQLAGSAIVNHYRQIDTTTERPVSSSWDAAALRQPTAAELDGVRRRLWGPKPPPRPGHRPPARPDPPKPPREEVDVPDPDPSRHRDPRS